MSTRLLGFVILFTFLVSCGPGNGDTTATPTSSPSFMPTSTCSATPTLTTTFTLTPTYTLTITFTPTFTPTKKTALQFTPTPTQETINHCLDMIYIEDQVIDQSEVPAGHNCSAEKCDTGGNSITIITGCHDSCGNPLPSDQCPMIGEIWCTCAEG
jgi:hypothetical protein